MPKQKTHKATAKRYRVTGNGKKLTIERRRSGQAHFNQKQRGKTERAKRRDFQPDTIKGFIKVALPN
jgi:ribosomal protein L35